MTIDNNYYQDSVPTEQQVQAMARGARWYLEVTSEPQPMSLAARMISIRDSVLVGIEGALGILGLADVFAPVESTMERQMGMQKVTAILFISSIMIGALSPVLGIALASAIIGGAVLGITVLSFLYPFIRPQADTLPRGINWTRQLERGELFVSEGRSQTLDQIAHAFGTNANNKTHALLIGKSGVGKTATAKAFTQAVARGKYPTLQGKEVIYFNTADLLSGTEVYSNANKIFTQISKAMGRHRENFILVFDEIHSFCKGDASLAEQLKTMLDSGQDKFPYVIGITTEEEYAKYVHTNPALDRRFQPVEIANTDRLETQAILKSALLKQAPHILVEDETMGILLERVIEKFGEEATQPATALKVLDQCIRLVSDEQRSPLEERVEQLRSEIDAYYRVYSGKLFINAGQEDENSITEKETELSELERRLLQSKQGIQELFQKRKTCFQAKRAWMQSIVRATTEAERMTISSNHWTIESLQNDIIKEGKKLGVRVVIDADVIDKALEGFAAQEQQSKISNISNFKEALDGFVAQEQQEQNLQNIQLEHSG